MTAKKQTIARITVGDVMQRDVFDAIEQGLPLWLEAERAQTGKADPNAALCAGSFQALKRALELLCFFASQRKRVAVRVTLPMLDDVPHGALTPSQVFYRWNARLGENGSQKLRGAPTINGRTFVVRPIVDWVKRGERIVRVEVALQRRKHATPEVVPFEPDHTVDITHPLPHDPNDLRMAANRVVRLTKDAEPKLSRILTTLFEEFGIVIRNILGWFQRRNVVQESTLLLARETGVEVVLIMAAGGGVGTAPTGDDPGFEIEERTKADEARAALHNLFQSPIEELAASEQNIYDLLDSMPSAEEETALRAECVRLRDEADRATDAAAAELTARRVINDAWLVDARAHAAASTREMVLGRGSHEAALDLARRHVHAGRETTAIAGRLAMRAASGVEEPSPAHRDALAATQQIADSLPRFYGTPILHAILVERLTVLHQLLERYKTSITSSS